MSEASAQAYIRKAARLHNQEVEHVPAYSHSNRWVGVGGACGDEWIVTGKIRWSQGNRDYRRGTVQLAQRFRNASAAGTWGTRQTYRADQEARCDRAESRGQCGQAGRCALRHDSGGERATLSSHHCNGRGQGLRSHRHGIARAQRTIRSCARQCYKQGADAHENPGVGVSLNSRAARLAAISYRPCWHVCPAGRHRIWPRYAGKATTQKEERDDNCPLHRCSCHHGYREPLSRLAKQGVSQISGRRVLRVIGHFVLSLSRRCFGASVGDKFCRNTSDQRWPLHRPFHPLLSLFLFWLRQEASGLKRTPSHVSVRYGPKADFAWIPANSIY